MKFKKIFTFLIVFILAIGLVGCGNQNTETAIASNLDKDAKKLMSIVNTLDDIEYEDIVIEDISPISDSYNVKNTSALKKTKIYKVSSQNREYVNDSILSSSKPKQNSNAQYVNGSKIDATNEIYPKKYTPKYVNDVSENFSRDNLDLYINNLEQLYNVCADCLSCDAECKLEKSRLEQNLKDSKVYIQKLKDGSIKLSENEILKCNEILKDLTSCTTRLKSTKGIVYSKINQIALSKDNFTAKIDALTSQYQNLLEALDTRLDTLKCCNTNLNCIYDIINKTNVDVKKAEQNKSDKEDLILSQEKLNNENRYNNQVENDNQVSNVSKKTPIKNVSEKNQTNKNTGTNKRINVNGQNNQQNIIQNTYPQNYNPNGYGYPYQNGYGYPYQNGYNAPYQYAPYPPRNIDTYRNVQKNIDTYAPQYLPDENAENPNNTNLQKQYNNDDEVVNDEQVEKIDLNKNDVKNLNHNKDFDSEILNKNNQNDNVISTPKTDYTSQRYNSLESKIDRPEGKVQKKLIKKILEENEPQIYGMDRNENLKNSENQNNLENNKTKTATLPIVKRTQY